MTDSLPAAGGPVTTRPITHGSVEVTHGADVIFVDPAPPSRLYADLPKATLILITHDHEDHFDARIISEISTRQRSSPSAARWKATSTKRSQ
jgi:L-ascorbate metabolism protein UlaG (beta-lactamase superfamily)